MADETKTQEKKATEAKAAPSKKTPARRQYNKGQTLTCEICGLSVVVEEIGGEAVEEESMVLCCGKPMKEKAATKKAT